MSQDLIEARALANSLTSLVNHQGPIDKIEHAVKRSQGWMRGNPDAAEILLPVIKRISDLQMPVGEAELVLAQAYASGDGVCKDPEEALRHLRAGMALGHEKSKLWYALWLQGKPEDLRSVLPADPDEALRIFRSLDDSPDHAAAAMASDYALLLLISDRTSDQVSSEELSEIEKRFRNSHSNRFNYLLAKFYTSHLSSTDYQGPEYRRARELLAADLESSSMYREASKALLQQWNILPEPAEPNELKSAFMKAAPIDKATVVAIPFILIFWTVAGLALTAAIAAIQPFLLIILAAFFVVIFLVGKLRK